MQVMARKTEILDVAEKVLSRFGPRRTTMEDIADELSISRPAIYQYFSSKRDLLKDVAINIHQKSMDRITAELELGGSLEEQIIRALNARDGFFLTDDVKFGTQPWYLDVRNRDIAEIVQSSAHVFESRIRRHLKKNDYPEQDVEAMASLLIASSTGLRMTVKDMSKFETLLCASVRQLLGNRVYGPLDARVSL